MLALDSLWGELAILITKIRLNGYVWFINFVIVRGYGYISSTGIHEQWDSISVYYCFPCSSYLCSFNKSSDRHLVLHSEQTKSFLASKVLLSLLPCILIKIVYDVHILHYIGTRCIKAIHYLSNSWCHNYVTSDILTLRYAGTCDIKRSWFSKWCQYTSRGRPRKNTPLSCRSANDLPIVTPITHFYMLGDVYVEYSSRAEAEPRSEILRPEHLRKRDF